MKRIKSSLINLIFLLILTIIGTNIEKLNNLSSYYLSPEFINKFVTYETARITKLQPLASYSGTQNSNLTLNDGDQIGTTTIPEGSNVTWTLKSNGTTSEDNINITGRINVKGKLTIKLNESSFTSANKNYYFRLQDGSYSEIFYIYSTGQLIIEGTSGHYIIVSGRAGYNSTSNGYKGENSRIEDVNATSGRPTISSSAIKNEGFLSTNYFILENINAESSSAGGGLYLASAKETILNNTRLKWIKGDDGAAIYLTSSSSGDLLIKNSTIQQCATTKKTELGGVIRTVGVTASNITIEDSVFKYNYSNGHGGAVYWNASNRLDTSPDRKEPLLTINNSNFISNYAGLRGGSMMIESNAKILGDCTIENNTAEYGGGINVNGYGGGSEQADTVSTFKIEFGSGLTIKNNTSKYGGGLAFVLDQNMTLGVGSSISLEINGAKITNNTATTDGGSIWFVNNSVESNNYIATLKMNSGNINDNTTTGNGGGFYLNNVDLIMQDGQISGNTGKNGGGIYIYNANLTLNGGTIINNTATNNGGGVYLESENATSAVEMKNGTISSNKATNGAGLYIASSSLSFDGGNINQNIASSNGGGFYIGDNSTIELNNGLIYNNTAKNGGGIFQTQNSNKTATKLTGQCEIKSNIAQNGNGGGVYIEGGSLVDVSGGKIIKNQASITDNTLKPASGTSAKNSSLGVGGGVYLQKGTFSMANSHNSAGIYGNIASYAADDLFASGTNTLFDAIPVLDMLLEDEYANADFWFEDYPKGEKHLSLNLDNRVEITSPERYKLTDVNSMEVATSVLESTNDYICITMGKSLGDLVVRIKDINVALDHIFIFKLISVTDPTQQYEFIVTKEKETKLVDIPSGNYILKITPDWSWRYSDLITSTIIENEETRKVENSNETQIKIYSYKETDVTTSYNLNNKKWLTKGFFPKKVFTSIN